MGLQDRDYMHDRGRRDRPSAPASSRPQPLWLMILVVASAAFGLFKGYDWLLERRAPVPTVPERGPLPERLPERAPEVSPAPAPVAPPAHWVRCEVNGQTLYADTQCPDNTETGRAPAGAPSQPAVASGSRVSTLYHCKSYSGGTFWASTHCNQHQALVDRIAGVPAYLPLDQQVLLADSQRRAATQLQSSTTTTVVNNVVVSDKKDACLSLKRQIEHLDAWARQPLPAQEQDRIREQRKQARDRQFALRC